jgi:hypothetical protein
MIQRVMRSLFFLSFGLSAALSATAGTWEETQRLALQQELRAAAPRVELNQARRLRVIARMVPVFSTLIDENSVSACASFAFLSRVTFEAVDNDPETFMAVAPYFLSDVRVLRIFRRRLEQRMRRIPGSSYVLRTDYLPSWEDEREVAFGKLMGSGGERVLIPAWLGKHYGRRHPDLFVPPGARPSTEYGDGGQGLRDGYRQGDHDDSGRHDHYLMNVALGYALERSRPPLVLRYTLPGWLIDRVNRALGPLADYESEHTQGANDVASSTDVLVNRAGRAQGTLFAQQVPFNGIGLNTQIYSDVCDESLLRPRIEGPLTPAALGDAYEAAANRARSR